jgi:hemolysin-activating ACP:hemolysin acyltransferase
MDTRGRGTDIEQARTDFQTSLGQIVSVLTAVPRYGACRFGDIMKLVVEPLARGNIVVAHPHSIERRLALPGGLAGILIWAKTSRAVDLKISRQIKRGEFPIALHGPDWNSGSVCWILDLIAPDGAQAAAILRRHLEAACYDTLKLHPQVSEFLGSEGLAKTNLVRPVSRH